MRRKVMLIFMSTALTLVMATAAYAANYASPVEIITDLTGKTSEQVLQERSDGKTFGQVAEESNVLEAFRDEMVEHKLAVIDQRVNDGKLSLEEGEAVKKLIAERMSNCQRNPDEQKEKMHQKFGGGLGNGNGEGERDGNGNGERERNGNGKGQGRGMGFNKTVK